VLCSSWSKSPEYTISAYSDLIPREIDNIPDIIRSTEDALEGDAQAVVVTLVGYIQPKKQGKTSFVTLVKTTHTVPLFF
jgi:hypothetical protein